MKVQIINGPNLNLLGTREPEIYGEKTLRDIEKDLTKVAHEKSVKLECFQKQWLRKFKGYFGKKKSTSV